MGHEEGIRLGKEKMNSGSGAMGRLGERALLLPFASASA